MDTEQEERMRRRSPNQGYSIETSFFSSSSSSSSSPPSVQEEECNDDSFGLLVRLTRNDHEKRVAECEAIVVEEEEQETFGRGEQENEQGQDEKYHHIPSVSAIPLHEAAVCLSPVDSFVSMNQHETNGYHSKQEQEDDLTNSHNTTLVPTMDRDGRPEFIFASIVVPESSVDVDATTNFGLVFENSAQNGKEVIVSRVQDDSPFLDTYVEPGDVIVAVNGISCTRINLERVQTLIRASTAKLSLCVRNPRGDPTIVSSSILKPQPTAKIGITLSRCRDTMRIKHLADDSLFADTLLLPCQRCIAINGIPCECLSAKTASAIISSSKTRRVTIVSKVQRSRAVTLAVDQWSTDRWWRKVACRRGLITGNAHAAIVQRERLWQPSHCSF